MKSILSFAFIASICLFETSLFAQDRQSELKNGILTLYADEYQATFSFGHRWNLSGLVYGEVPIIAAGGANQFTVKMQDGTDETLWYGGIARPESVEELTLYIDEVPHRLSAAEPGKNQVFSFGERYSVEKVSKVGPYKITLRTTLSAEGLNEELIFAAAAPSDNVAFIYPSRFSFIGDFSQWFAQMADGFEEEGDLGTAQSTFIDRITSHLALYDPKHQYVTLLSTLEEPASEDGKHFIWRDQSRYQFHSRRPVLRDIDGSITTRRHLKIWPVEGGDWREQARQKMENKN